MSVCSAAAGELAAAKDKSLFLIVDYLPAAVYAGDEIALNVRVENVSKAAVSAELTLEGQKRDGEKFALKTQSIQCPAGGFSSASFTVASGDATAFSLKLNAGGATLAGLSVDVLHDDEACPKTVVRAGVIEKEAAGERIVWSPARREKKIDRAFAPMKWLLGSDKKKDEKDKTAEQKRVLAFVPGGYQSANQVVQLLGPYPLDGNAPVLHAAREVLSRLEAMKASGVALAGFVIVLPPEDIEVATDPRLFRVVLDGLLTRLKSGGVARVAVIPPFKYGISDERMKVFWKEAADACATHQAQYADPTAFLNETFWRADPAHAGAYSAKPNAAGREQLGVYLKELGVNGDGK